MRTACILALLALWSFGVTGAFADDPKREAEEEIRQAFEEADREVEDESKEATGEIDEAEEEAIGEIDEATAEAKREGSTPEAIDEAMDEMKEAVKEAMVEAREAVEEIRREAVEAVEETRHESNEAIEEFKEEACEGDRGGGGALTVQILGFDTDPFADLNNKEADLKGKLFDFDKRILAMIGGIGYYDVGNGARVGMAGAVGYKYYVSDVYTTVDTNNVSLDSAAILRIWPAYLGFNFEKAFKLNKVTLFMGGLFGGGVYVMHKKFEDRTNPSAFINLQSDTTQEDTDDDRGSLGFATFMAWDFRL